MAVLHERFVQVQGRVQNQDGVVHLKAERVWPLSMSEAATQSHDSTDTGVSTMPGSPIRYAAIVGVMGSRTVSNPAKLRWSRSLKKDSRACKGTSKPVLVAGPK